MTIHNIIAQLRTTDLDRSIDFYTSKLGMSLEFRYQDFYAGIRSGDHIIHLKRVDKPDPSIADVREHGHFHLYFSVDDADALAAAMRDRGVALVSDVCDTEWQTREFVIEDDQGHVLYFGQPL